MSWKQDCGYEGLLVEFLNSLLEDFYPNTVIVSKAQNWLIGQLKLKEGPFTIRHAKDVRKLVNREGCIKPRYYFSNDFKGLKIGFDIIASDNESTSSFYTLLINGFEDFSVITMKEMLQTKIYTGILRKEKTPKIELAAFNTNRIKSGMNNYKRRPAQFGLKLCHILDAGKNIENNVSQNQLLERAFRCLNPINLFPFPNNKYNHYLDEIEYADLGEDNGIQELFAALIQLHFLKSDNSNVKNAIAKYYLYLNKEIPSIKNCEEIVTRYKDKIVKIVSKPKNKKVETIVTKSSDVSLNTLECYNNSTFSKQLRIELSSQTRLKFNAQEIRSLGESQVVFFHINAEANRYQSDPREIHGIFTCKVSDIKTFFDWNNDRNWNNQYTHSWSRFPNWAKGYFKGKLGDVHL